MTSREGGQLYDTAQLKNGLMNVENKYMSKHFGMIPKLC